MAKPTPEEVARRLIIIKFQVVRTLSTPPIVKSAYDQWPGEEQTKFRQKMQQTTDEMIASFHGVGLWEFLTDNEIEFFSTNPLDLTQEKIINGSWRMESVMVLMWSLRLIATFRPFDSQTETDLMKEIPNEHIFDFFSNAKLLDEKSIEHQRDLAELWHWRSRTRELMENDVKPEGLGGRSLDEIVRSTATVAHNRGDLPIPVDEDFPVLGKAYRDLSDEAWSSVRSIAFERHFALNWLCGYAPDNDWDQTPTDT